MSLVMKFGGTSVQDASAMRQVGSVIRQRIDRAPLVVLSAMSGVTNQLIDAAHSARDGSLDRAMDAVLQLQQRQSTTAKELFEATPPETLTETTDRIVTELQVLLQGVALLQELSPRSLDAISAVGERLSTALLAAWLAAEGLEAVWFDARRVLRTDDQFGEARPLDETLSDLTRTELSPLLKPGSVVITQGFVGATADGLTTTLGRGGSDYSAALLGAALQVEEVQIWTDVEGIMTCDPRIAPDARPLTELSFGEAAELAAFGAKVLHPATIHPAVKARIPVTVRHTRRPDGAFTTIRGDIQSGRSVSALAGRGPITVLTVSSLRMLDQSGWLARLFEIFARHKVSVDIVATAEVSVSLTIDASVPLTALCKELEGICKVEVATGRAIVAIVGERLKRTPGLSSRVFRELDGMTIEMISMGANELNLSLVVLESDREEVLRRLHRGLISGNLNQREAEA